MKSMPESHRSLLEIAQQSANGQSAEQSWQAINAACNEIGILGIGYGFFPIKKEAELYGNSSAFFIHSYSQEWMDSLDSKKELENDISVDAVLTGRKITFWNGDMAKYKANSAQIQQRQMEIDIGMQQGATMALLDDGFSFSALGINAGNITDMAFMDLWQKHRTSIMQLGHLLDETLRQQNPGKLVQLAPRKQDALTYFALGLRAVEVADCLRISEKTLEKYVYNAKRKLRAKTRDHAIVKAVKLRLLQP